jgi:hypothetical protein
MKHVFFLLLVINLTLHGQAAWKVEGTYFKIMNQSTGEELSKINNYKTIKGFSIDHNSINLFSESCKSKKCITEINTYTLRKGIFEYDNTTKVDSEIEFAVCLNGMKNVLEHRMAVDKNGYPIYTVSGNQSSLKEGIRCLHMVYFSGKGDYINTKLAGYFDANKDGTNDIQHKLLKRFFVEMEGFRINSLEFVNADLKSIEKVNALNTKSSYIIHNSGTLEDLQISFTKITSISTKKIKEKIRKKAKNNNDFLLEIDCNTCPDFKE